MGRDDIFTRNQIEAYNLKSGEYHIKNFYRLANGLAIAPPYTFDKIQEKKSKPYTYYSLAVTVLILGTYIYGMYGVFKKIYTSAQTTTIVIQILYYLFVTCSNVISVLGSALYNWKNWINMLNIYVKLDSQMHFSGAKRTRKSLFNAQIIVGHIMLASVLIYDTYVGQESFGFNLYQFYICFRLQYYFIFLYVILVCYFAVEVKLKFEYFNGILKKVIETDQKPFTIKNTRNSISPIALGAYNQSNNLKNVTRMFTILSEFVDLYNKLFGWQILILMGIVLMALLETFNFIMVYGIAVKEEFGKNAPVDMIAQSLATTLVFLAWGVLVIIYCDAANKEIQNSATISFQLLPEMSETTSEVKKLLFLAQQAANRCPQLSAANVFDVNISTLFALFGSITTYVVVVIQFNTM